MNQMKLDGIQTPAQDPTVPSVEKYDGPVSYTKSWELQDIQIVVFHGDSARDEYMDYLAYRKMTDKWLYQKVNALCAVPITKSPLFRKDDAENASYVKNGISSKFWIPIDVTDPKVDQCINEGLFLLGLETERGIEAVPMRYTAVASVYQRAGVYCEGMLLVENKGKTHPVDIHKKADFFNSAKDVREKCAVVLIRDGKVGYAGSEVYQPLCPYQGARILEDAIKAEHPDMTFKGGMASHEYLVGEYMLNDEMMEASVLAMMGQAGAKVHDLRAGVRYSTSEVGTSCMTAKCFLEYQEKKDGHWTTLTLPGEVAVPHEGKGGGMTRWAQELQKLGAIFQEAEDRLESLGNTPISDICACVQAIRDVYTFLPGKETQSVIEDLRTEYPDGKGTAMDVFLALNDIASRFLKNAEVTPSRYVAVTEQVQRLIFLDYGKIDATGECPKKK